ncbi:MAG: hypothetical protein LBC61_04470 [Candidatus Peribacteria bacterium]|nr:hypothetical protein [Candidatus Peribacteria bacterium]
MTTLSQSSVSFTSALNFSGSIQTSFNSLFLFSSFVSGSETFSTFQGSIGYVIASHLSDKSFCLFNSACNQFSFWSQIELR